MFSKDMLALGQRRSVIREIFEYGNRRAAEIGRENVFDFSLGNPNVPAPACVQQALEELMATQDPVALHSYTSAPGDPAVRRAVAQYIQDAFGAPASEDLVYMTAGAAASLCICLRALCCPGDEFIAITPFFPEYRVFVEAAGGKLVVVPSNEGDFQVDAARFAQAITPHTKAVLLNSPNNPSGVVLSEDTIQGLCGALREKAQAYGHPIYLITDEPYRELVYDGVQVPYLMNYYDDTFVCTSFSKSLSLPGERIGYIAVSGRMGAAQEAFAALCGAGRALGYVCAPSLFQRVIARCLGKTADVSVYKKNRDLLFGGLSKMGYSCVRPDGAFYLFVKSPEPDANQFCERAKAYELLLVPGDDFGCPGYVRISYCVTTRQIERALPAFERLMAEYRA